MSSLAVKYRPQRWVDVVEQSNVVRILEQQIKTKDFKNAYLFAGASGCGKTTNARLFANEINEGVGYPIELDCASNNGVDSVRALVKSAQERSIDSTYKVIILDECQNFSSSAWGALLKCIEETPKYTIFIFCTTDPQKVPNTILNRVQRFDFKKISTNGIVGRLEYICQKEGYQNYKESIEYIAKISGGCMRQAIALLEKCVSDNKILDIKNTLSVLGNYSYDVFFTLINATIDNDGQKVLKIIEYFYNNGNDLSVFVEQYTAFTLDVAKYSLFKDCSTLTIPPIMEDKLKYTVGIDNASAYFMKVIDKLLKLKQSLRNDTDVKTTIEITFLQICRCVW